MSVLDFPRVEGYLLDREPLRFGPHCCVYRGVSVDSGREMEVKLIPRENYTGEVEVSRILSVHSGFAPLGEKRTLADFVAILSPLTHSHKDLYHYLRSQGCLEETDVWRVLEGILRGLVFAHSVDIALLDLSVENLLVNWEAGRCSVQVCEYSSATFLRSGDSCLPWSKFSCRRARPPEICRRDDADAKKVDVWEAGVVGCLLLCCEPDHACVSGKCFPTAQAKHNEYACGVTKPDTSHTAPCSARAAPSQRAERSDPPCMSEPSLESTRGTSLTPVVSLGRSSLELSDDIDTFSDADSPAMAPMPLTPEGVVHAEPMVCGRCEGCMYTRASFGRVLTALEGLQGVPVSISSSEEGSVAVPLLGDLVHCSSEMRELLQRILTYEQELRPTAEEALKLLREARRAVLSRKVNELVDEFLARDNIPESEIRVFMYKADALVKRWL